LPLYEPRVKIDSVVININPNWGYYTIKLTVTIPSLDKTVDINSILSKDGYTILG
jgi:hypothetical protein